VFFFFFFCGGPFWGDASGVTGFEKDVDEEDGEVLPPQPKKAPSFDAPGDFGSCVEFCWIWAAEFG